MTRMEIVEKLKNGKEVIITMNNCVTVITLDEKILNKEAFLGACTFLTGFEVTHPSFSTADSDYDRVIYYSQQYETFLRGRTNYKY